jgi:E3 ubiquitin-protein ligase CHFR
MQHEVGTNHGPNHAENLIFAEFKCGICLDLVHECVSLAPCLHIFCGGCCSDWFKTKINCPLCSQTTTEVHQNRNIKNFIEKLISTHPNPGKFRGHQELDELSQKNIFNGKPTTRLDEILKIHPSKCIECFLPRPADSHKCPPHSPDHLACSHCHLNFPTRKNYTPFRCSVCTTPCCGLYFSRCKDKVTRLCLSTPPSLSNENFIFANDIETSRLL